MLNSNTCWFSTFGLIYYANFHCIKINHSVTWLQLFLQQEVTIFQSSFVLMTVSSTVMDVPTFYSTEMLKAFNTTCQYTVPSYDEIISTGSLSLRQLQIKDVSLSQDFKGNLN